MSDVKTFGALYDFARVLDLARASIGHRSEFAMFAEIRRRGIVVDSSKLADWRTRYNAPPTRSGD